MAEKIRVVVVDDHPLYRSGVVATLKDYEDVEVVGEGSSVGDATKLAEGQQPDIVLLDISMPGNGLNAVGEILKLSAKTRIVMLTASEDEAEVMAALDAGASGYALKGIGGDELVSIVRGVAEGNFYVAPTLAGRLLVKSKAGRATPEALAMSTLSAREQDVAGLLTEGRSNKEIARALGLQEKTVKHHMTQILQKLRVRNRVEAAMAVRNHKDQRSN